jgi:hypothetical protein
MRPALTPEDFAVRREVILKKPADKPAAEPPPASAEPAAESRPEPPVESRPEPAAEPHPAAEAVAPPVPAPAAATPAKPEDNDTKSVFDNLEDEMASLLGRGGNRP